MTLCNLVSDNVTSCILVWRRATTSVTHVILCSIEWPVHLMLFSCYFTYPRAAHSPALQDLLQPLVRVIVSERRGLLELVSIATAMVMNRNDRRSAAVISCAVISGPLRRPWRGSGNRDAFGDIDEGCAVDEPMKESCDRRRCSEFVGYLQCAPPTFNAHNSTPTPRVFGIY